MRKAGSFLLDVVLPKFVQDLCSLEVSPMDGQTLTDALHSHGINVRYLGKVRLLPWGTLNFVHMSCYLCPNSSIFSQVAEMVKHLPHLLDLCSSEIVVRSAKHIAKVPCRTNWSSFVNTSQLSFSIKCQIQCSQKLIDVTNVHCCLLSCILLK